MVQNFSSKTKKQKVDHELGLSILKVDNIIVSSKSI